MGVRYPHIFLIVLLLHEVNAASTGPVKKWLTLNGAPPLVIAQGGFSGLFPDSSQLGYQFALSSSLPELVLFCDLQLSRDNFGFCKTGLPLDNSTLIAEVFPKNDSTYKLNGEDINGWFSVDFTSTQLIENVTLIQNVLSRPHIFDGTIGLSTLDDIASVQPRQIWVNVQYGQFFHDHKLSSEEYISSKAKEIGVNFVSSPNIGFLRSLGGKLRKSNVKLIFRFLDEQLIEPYTKQTYGTILKDLKYIKAFAAGILVPKACIWPLNKNQYLQSATSLVKDAHSLGLEVYASGFANDFLSSYNYSYDPNAEYLQFIDNTDFSVDGVLTDFSSTASAAVACLAHTKENPLRPPGNDSRPLIITHNGASGTFPGSTDLSYQEAVENGADVIDCSVQMTKDAVPFCLDSPDLSKGTTAAAVFMTKVTTVNEIQNGSGIFSFDLSWSEIQTLKPDLVGPYSQEGLKRNPAVKNSGKLLTLADFLAFSNSRNVSGILINIRNAPYLASRGINIIDAVSSALVNASYDKETRQQVLIQSDDSAVLRAFKMKFLVFKRVLHIGNAISDVSTSSVEDMTKFVDAVSVSRGSVIQAQGSFLLRFTDVVAKLHAANMLVFVGTLKNEFMNLGFDFLADPMVEIATYSSLMADGIVTEFPATAAAYFKSPCSDFSRNLTYTILPAKPGSLLHLADPGALPPAQGPAPVLEPADVVDPPIPPVAIRGAAAPSSNDSNSTSDAAAGGASTGFGLLVAGLAALASLSSQ